ncbi:uncharacterized protein LOC144452005 isoform X2 [Glandiceps talaboti]
MSENADKSGIASSSDRSTTKPKGKSFISRLPSLRKKKAKTCESQKQDSPTSAFQRSPSKKEKKKNKKRAKQESESRLENMAAAQYVASRYLPYTSNRLPGSQEPYYKGPSLQNIRMVSKTSEKVAQYEHRLSTLKEQEQRSNPKVKPNMEKEKNGTGPRMFGEEVKAKSSRFGYLGGSKSSRSSSENSDSSQDENQKPADHSIETLIPLTYNRQYQVQTKRLTGVSPSKLPTMKDSSMLPQPTTSVQSSSSSLSSSSSSSLSASKVGKSSYANGAKVYGRPALYKSVFKNEDGEMQLSDELKRNSPEPIWVQGQTSPSTVWVQGQISPSSIWVQGQISPSSMEGPSPRQYTVQTTPPPLDVSKEQEKVPSRAGSFETSNDSKTGDTDSEISRTTTPACNEATTPNTDEKMQQSQTEGKKLSDEETGAIEEKEKESLAIEQGERNKRFSGELENTQMSKIPTSSRKDLLTDFNKSKHLEDTQITQSQKDAEISETKQSANAEDQKLATAQTKDTLALPVCRLDTSSDNVEITGGKSGDVCLQKVKVQGEESQQMSENDFQTCKFVTSTPRNEKSKSTNGNYDNLSSYRQEELVTMVRNKIDNAFNNKMNERTPGGHDKLEHQYLTAKPPKPTKHVSIDLPVKDAKFSDKRHCRPKPESPGVMTPEKVKYKQCQTPDRYVKHPKFSELRSESLDFDSCDLDSLASDDLMFDDHFLDDDEDAFLSKSAGAMEMQDKMWKPVRYGCRERSASFEERLEKRGSLKKKKAQQGSYGSLPRITKKKEETSSTDTLDELNTLMGTDKRTQRLKHLHVAARGRSYSSPSTFRPPRQMSMPTDEADGVEIDYHSYRQMVTEMTGIKTMLHRLKRVIQNSDTISPFDPLLKSLASPLSTPCHSDPTSPVGDYKKLPPGYNLDILFQENQELRLKVLQFESKEEEWKKLSEEKEEEISLLKEQVDKLSEQVNIEKTEVGIQTDVVQDSRVKRHQSMPAQQPPGKRENMVSYSANSVPKPLPEPRIEPRTEPKTEPRTESRPAKPQVYQNRFSPSAISLQNTKLQSTNHGMKSKTKNESNKGTRIDLPMQSLQQPQTQQRRDTAHNRLEDRAIPLLSQPNRDRRSPTQVSVVVESKAQTSNSTPMITSSKQHSAHSQAKELSNGNNHVKKNGSKIATFLPKRYKSISESPLSKEQSSTLTLTNNEELSNEYTSPSNGVVSRLPTATTSSAEKKKSRSRLPKPRSYHH